MWSDASGLSSNIPNLPLLLYVNNLEPRALPALRVNSFELSCIKVKLAAVSLPCPNWTNGFPVPGFVTANPGKELFVPIYLATYCCNVV